MTLKIRLVLAFLMLGLIGCEHSRVTFGGEPETKYHQLLHSQTRYERLYGLDKALYETYVTYMTPELAEEYVNEYARIFSLNDFKKEGMLAEMRANQAKYDEFMVAHYASENDNIRLNNQDPKTIVWKFFLKTNDTANGMVEAVEINNTPVGTQLRYFYPHLSQWARLYRVRFPKTETVGKTMVMKGTVRELTFVWK